MAETRFFWGSGGQAGRPEATSQTTMGGFGRPAAGGWVAASRPSRVSTIRL